MTQQLQFPVAVEGTVNPVAAARAKTAGMAIAAAATRPDWATACRRAIELMARRGVEFQAADLVAEDLVDDPDSPSQWGPAFSHAAHDGVIVAAGYAPSKRATVRGSACRTWVGAGGAA